MCTIGMLDDHGTASAHDEGKESCIEFSQVQLLICVRNLHFLSAAGLAVPHWYASNAREEDEFQPDEPRLTNGLPGNGCKGHATWTYHL